MKKRVLLKLSGEVMGGKRGDGIEAAALLRIAKEIVRVNKAGIQIAVVIGGGNIWRFRDNEDLGIERTTSDFMGMLATVLNSEALQSAIEKMGVPCRVLSAIDLPKLAEPFYRGRAIRHLEKGRVVLCAGGTGNPYFTTDTAAALRAAELSCDRLLKATKVDGVYDADPMKVKGAKRFDRLTYDEAIRRNLKVMDQTAFALCKENGVEIQVFDMGKKDAILKAAKGDKVGTLVS